MRDIARRAATGRAPLHPTDPCARPSPSPLSCLALCSTRCTRRRPTCTCRTCTSTEVRDAVVPAAHPRSSRSAAREQNGRTWRWAGILSRAGAGRCIAAELAMRWWRRWWPTRREAASRRPPSTCATPARSAFRRRLQGRADGAARCSPSTASRHRAHRRQRQLPGRARGRGGRPEPRSWKGSRRARIHRRVLQRRPGALLRLLRERGRATRRSAPMPGPPTLR